MRLLYFNPANDLALADGGARYMPPAGARAIGEAGATLPLWYGSPGDLTLCHGVNAAWFDAIMADFALGTDVWPMRYEPEMAATPWGWSMAARQAYLDAGFPASVLPTPSQIEAIRQLSHRRTSALLARRLASALPSLPIRPAEEYTDADALCSRLRREGGVVKTPWSTSGRGVAFAADSVDKCCRLAASAIAKQGGAMYEPAYGRALDFAMLFATDGGTCRSCGTSVFATDVHGHYIGNLMAAESERLAKVAALCDINTLHQVREALRHIIEEEIAPTYSGPMGVDMLIATDGTLVPVVELNLRMTMGHVAAILSDKLLPAGATATYRVHPGASAPTAYAASAGRLQSGTLQLTPPNPHFRFEVEMPQ